MAVPVREEKSRGGLLSVIKIAEQWLIVELYLYNGASLGYFYFILIATAYMYIPFVAHFVSWIRLFLPKTTLFASLTCGFGTDVMLIIS